MGRISCIINWNLADGTADGHQSRTPLIKSQMANSLGFQKNVVRSYAQVSTRFSVLAWTWTLVRETGILATRPSLEGENIPERDMDHGSPLDTRCAASSTNRSSRSITAALCAVRAHTRPPADN